MKPVVFSNAFFLLFTLQVLKLISCIKFDPIRHPNWKLLNNSFCGTSSTDRIIGGTIASLGQFPWLARVYVHSNKLHVGSYMCGGAIINSRYVLTAAHCKPSVADFKITLVRVGEFDADTDPDCQNEICAPPVRDYEVEKVIQHEKYKIPYEFKNDLLLLRLKQPIEFNEFVRPICMVHGTLMNHNHAGEMMDVAGWGVMDIATGEQSTVLKTLKVPVFTDLECKETFSHLAVIGKEQLCAGGVVGHDSCSGDSGGPLMKVFHIDNYPKYYLIGVVSFGAKYCGETDKPGVYIRVSYFVKWILDNIAP